MIVFANVISEVKQVMSCLDIEALLNLRKRSQRDLDNEE